MTDDERDARINTLIDAIADTNRNVAALATQVDKLATQVDKLADLMDRHLRFDHGYGDDE